MPVACRGLPVACPWVARVVLVGCPWIARGVHVGCPWIARGVPVGGVAFRYLLVLWGLTLVAGKHMYYAPHYGSMVHSDVNFSCCYDLVYLLDSW